jgi:hypothetical protein
MIFQNMTREYQGCLWELSLINKIATKGYFKGEKKGETRYLHTPVILAT